MVFAVSGGAWGQGRLLQLPALGIQLRVPAQWSVVRVIEGRGASIGEPEGDGPALDIVAWQPLSGELSPEAAADAHEQIIGARYTYAAQERGTLTGADGARVVLSRGAVQTADGELFASLFSAFVIDGMYVVAGTFCAPGQEAQIRRDFFDEAVATLTKAGARVPEVVQPPVAPPDEPPAPTAPTPPVDPAPPVTTIGPVADPAAPPAAPVDELVLKPLQDDLGFSILKPEGWVLQIAGGAVQLWPPDRPRTMGAVVWPVLVDDQGALQDRSLRAAEAWAKAAGTRWTQAPVRLVGSDRLSTVELGTVAMDGQELFALATYTPGERVDLLQIALFSLTTPESARLKLAETLGSFECRETWVRDETPPGEGRWVGREAAIESEGEAGWVIIGGVSLYNGMPAVNIEARHPASGATFEWQQPRLPIAKELTEELAAAGWREGADFPPDKGIEPLVLARRISPLAAARESMLASSGMTVTASRTTSRARSLLPGAEGAMAGARSDARQAGVLWAIADAPARLGAQCFMSAALRYEGPSDTYRAAGAALRKLIEKARVRHDWPCTEDERAALLSLLEGAREAARDLPSSGPALPAKSGVRGAFDHLATAGSGSARRVTFPAHGPAMWKRAGTTTGAAEILPELLAD